MADIGADIVRIMHKTLRAQAGEPSIATILSDDFAPLTDMTPPLAAPHNKILQKASNAFGIVTQSMRRSIMLAQKLADSAATTPPTNPIPTGDIPTGDPVIGEGEAHPAPANPNNDRQDENERQDTEGREPETAQPECADRRDRPDSEFDLAARSFTNLLADIARAFGQQHTEWAEDIDDLEDTDFPEAALSPPLPAPTTPPKNPETNTLTSAPRPAPPFPPEPFPRL